MLKQHNKQGEKRIIRCSGCNCYCEPRGVLNMCLLVHKPLPDDIPGNDQLLRYVF